MKIKLNYDLELVAEAKFQLKENDGYCPCALQHTSETKCICKEFREKVKNGYRGECNCGLYISEDEGDNE